MIAGYLFWCAQYDAITRFPVTLGNDEYVPRHQLARSALGIDTSGDLGHLLDSICSGAVASSYYVFAHFLVSSVVGGLVSQRYFIHRGLLLTRIVCIRIRKTT